MMQHLTRPRFVSLVLLIILSSMALAAPKKKAPTWTDPAKAAAEDKDFLLQGEYEGEMNGPYGAQLVATGSGSFILVLLKGGLPCAARNGSDREVSLGKTEDGKTIKFAKGAVKEVVIGNGVMRLTGDGGKALGEMKRVERTSPSTGAKPPAGAVVLFDGSGVDKWEKGRMDGKLLAEGCNTKDSFGSFQLHLEFLMPYKPDRFPSNQDRGNSGVYTYNRYETQLLDSFGLHYNHFEKAEWAQKFQEELGTKPNSDRTQWGSAFYKFKCPDVNMYFPPLAWQTYDIDFTAPTFEGKNKVKNARITVRVNGVVVQDDVEMIHGGTGAGRGRGEIAEGQIFLQGHGNPVRFRNIWILEKK